jgi:hypothetical protein
MRRRPQGPAAHLSFLWRARSIERETGQNNRNAVKQTTRNLIANPLFGNAQQPLVIHWRVAIKNQGR